MIRERTVFFTDEQRNTVAAYIKENYKTWIDDERGFVADHCCDDVVEVFGITVFDLQCECQGIAEEICDEKYQADAYWWGVHLGFIKE